jgi:hypothetical protein
MIIEQKMLSLNHTVQLLRFYTRQREWVVVVFYFSESVVNLLKNSRLLHPSNGSDNLYERTVVLHLLQNLYCSKLYWLLNITIENIIVSVRKYATF